MKKQVILVILLGFLINYSYAQERIDYKIRTNRFYADVTNEGLGSAKEEVVWRIKYLIGASSGNSYSDLIAFEHQNNYAAGVWWDRGLEEIWEGDCLNDDDILYIFLEGWEEDGGSGDTTYDPGEGDQDYESDTDLDNDISSNTRDTWVDFKNYFEGDIDNVHAVGSDQTLGEYRVEIDIWWNWSLPALTCSLSNTTSSSFTVNMLNTESYRLSSWYYEVSTDVNFNQLVATGNITDGSTSETVSNLDPATTYYVRLRGTNEAGDGDFYETNTSVERNLAPSGAGTEGSPYEIAGIENLNWLVQNSVDSEEYFIQTANIDAHGTSAWNSGYGISRIGGVSLPGFKGKYDGNGKTISNIETNESGVGLFGLTSGAIIKNLGVLNANFSQPGAIGILVQQARDATKIINCYTSGTADGSQSVGGLVGILSASSVINCYSTANAIGSSTVGGLIGQSVEGLVINSYARGNATANISDNAGGLIGYFHDGSKMINCYSTGEPSITSETDIGGLVGKSYSYSLEALNCFWDTETSGITTSPKGTGKTTSQMKTELTFTDWDFTTPVWSIDEGNDYPNLGNNVVYHIWTGMSNSFWHEPGSWSLLETPTSTDDVYIPAVSSNPVLSNNSMSSPEECNNLTIETGSEVELASNNALTVSGNLINNGTLTVFNNENETSSLIIEGTATGDVISRRYVAKGSWHYISAPVIDISGFDQYLGLTGGANNDQFYWWDEDGAYDGSTGIWFDILNNPTGISYTVDNFVAAQGYAISYAGTGTKLLYFSGVPHTVNQSIDITKTSGSTNEGANLVGNPFTSTIAANSNADANSFLSTNTSLLDDTYGGIYLWDEQANYTGNRDDYLTISNSDDAAYIDPGQAFMIVKKDEGTSSLPFNTNMQKHGAATFYKNAEQDDVKRFYMSVENEEGLYNEILIAFMDGMTNGLDKSYDAGKMKGNPDIALYTKLVEDIGTDFAHQALPLLDDKALAVVTCLDVSTAGNYTFKIKELQNFDEAIPIKLEDKETGNIIDFRQAGEYSFFINEPGEIRERFVLHFNGVTGIDDDAQTSEPIIQTYASNNTLYILNPQQKRGTVTIYNLTGQEVAAFELSGDAKQQQNINVSDVINIVKVQIDSEVISGKVIFR